MDEYDELRTDIAAVADSLANYSLAVGRATGTHDLEIRRLWEGQAELRDDLHALANRVETLTRARLTEPAEVAARMVDNGHGFTCTEFGCYITHPHEHTTAGVLYR